MTIAHVLIGLWLQPVLVAMLNMTWTLLEEKVVDEDKASLEEDDADRKSERSTPTYSNQVTLDSPFTPE